MVPPPTGLRPQGRGAVRRRMWSAPETPVVRPRCGARRQSRRRGEGHQHRSVAHLKIRPPEPRHGCRRDGERGDVEPIELQPIEGLRRRPEIARDRTRKHRRRASLQTVHRHRISEPRGNRRSSTAMLAEPSTFVWSGPEICAYNGTRSALSFVLLGGRASGRSRPQRRQRRNIRSNRVLRVGVHIAEFTKVRAAFMG